MLHLPNYLEHLVFLPLNLVVSNLNSDAEAEEYFGYSFQLSEFKIKFRKSKITPKKTGQFVTLWKRNPLDLQTEPFNHSDDFDFYMIYAEDDDNSGYFFFTKDILAQKHILSTATKEGKRGFRIYPNWDLPLNKQALATQNWQKNFFIDLSDQNFTERFKNIIFGTV